jgi:ATP-dependent DNA helicase RecQ
VAAFVIFSDVTLRELARVRPGSIEAMQRVYGVGDRKLADLGERFLSAIRSYCRERGVTTDAADPAAVSAPAPRQRSTAVGLSLTKRRAFELFDEGRSIDQVGAETGRARSTISGYLADYIVERKPGSVDAWVTPDVYRRVAKVAAEVGGELMRPVYEALNGEVSYDDIRIVMRHLALEKPGSGSGRS